MKYCGSCGQSLADDMRFCRRCGVQVDKGEALLAGYSIVLSSYPPDQKIRTIKTLRNITGMGLKEAKDLIDHVPAPIYSGLTWEEAQRIYVEICASPETSACFEVVCNPYL